MTRIRARAWTVLLGLAAASALPAEGRAADENRIFTVGNYPVEARAANAVAAKEKAIADGQQAALRALLKRLVPVTAYNQLDKVKLANAAELIEGFAVRSERNSSTEYIASYDISFQPDGVRRILDQEGLPYVDQQAEPTVLAAVYRAPPAGGAPDAFSDAAGSDAWLYAWKSLDLANTLTPINLRPLPSAVPPDTIKAMLDGDQAAMSAISSQFQTPRVLIALLQPDAAGHRMRVTLGGRDAAGRFVLNRDYRIDGGDLAYAAELASVVSLGIIEGRWKAVADQTGGGGGASGPHVAADALRIAVEFSGMAEWQSISRQLSMAPNVSDVEVEGLSARSARIALRYAGPPEQLAGLLAERGLNLRNSGSGWVLSAR
jgi:hypothetical protein